MDSHGWLRIAICWCFLAVPEPTGAQEPTDTASSRAVRLPLDDVLAMEVEVRGGVHPKLDDELRSSARMSVGWALEWNVETISARFSLTVEERKVVSQAFAERKAAQVVAIDRARARVKKLSKPSSENLNQIKAAYAKDESRAESSLIAVLDEVFPPSKLREVLLLAIAAKEYEFGRIEFVQDQLKLEDAQVKAFEALPKFFLAQAFEQRARLGTSKYDPALARIAKARLVEARNLLNASQFEVYAQAIGLIPRDRALKDYLLSCSDEQRKELRTYRVCAVILQEADL